MKHLDLGRIWLEFKRSITSKKELGDEVTSSKNFRRTMYKWTMMKENQVDPPKPKFTLQI